MTAGLAKDAAGRPASASAFVEELERIAEETYGDGWEDRGVRVLAGAASRWPRCSRWRRPGSGRA
ncbi:hypothetical protein, partial [Actinomadura sp. CNU-125]|uniref:hypothetical protein n=1 Tax=Actinomadura sp. CNU-125 TaxID=1904961 RepID=UPI0021CC87F3